MPYSKYYGGHGEEVMAKMRETYKNDTKARQVFYATTAKIKKEREAERKKDKVK